MQLTAEEVQERLIGNGNGTHTGNEAESKLTGSLFASRELVFEIFDTYPGFSQEVFSSTECKKIFEAVKFLSEADEQVNAVTVAHKTGLSEQAVSRYLPLAEPGNALSYAGVLFDNYLRKKVLEYCKEAAGEILLPETDILAYSESLSGKISGILDNGLSKTEADAHTVAVEAMEEIIQMQKRFLSGNGTLTGIETGLEAENDFTGGYMPGDLVIVAARPGMGKSCKAANTALKAAKSGVTVGFLSLEMTNRQNMHRMFSIESDVFFSKIRNGKVDNTEAKAVNKAAELVSNLPIIFDEKAGADINYVKRLATRWKRKHGMGLFIVDYLQLITNNSSRYRGSKTYEVGEISQTLKILAKTLQVPVIALCQLSRAVETRGGTKRPILSDLRESGDLEQDADIVQFLYRPEIYGVVEDENGFSTKGMVELIFAKHRNGSLGSVTCGFNENCVKFYDRKPDKKEMKPFDPNYTPSPDSRITPSNRKDDEDLPF